MKRILAVILTFSFLLSIGFAGCGEKGTTDAKTTSTQAAKADDTKGTDSAKAKKAHVRMMYWNKEDSIKTLLNLIKEKLPNVELEFQFVDIKTFDSVFKTQMAAGEGPDLLTDCSEVIIKSGYAMDLKGQEFISRYHESIINDLTVDGKIYCIPGVSWFGGFLYNKEMFEKNNISIPKTWGDFLNACETLKKAGIKPLTTPAKNPNFLMHYALGFITPEFLRQPEGMNWDVDFKNGKAKMDGTLNKYMETWSELIKKGYLTKEDLGKDADQSLDEFATGKAAMLDSGPWDVPTIYSKNPNIKLDMMPFVGTKGDTGWLFGGPGIKFAVNSSSKNPNAVLSILDLMSTPEGQKAYWEDNKGGSSYLKGVEFEMPKEYDGCKDVFKEGHIYAPFMVWNQGVFIEFGKQLQDYLASGKTIDEVLKATDKKNEEVLRKNQGN